MEPKYKIGDLLTVRETNPAWYIYLITPQKELVGKTGRVVEVDTQTFTKEDKGWSKFNKFEEEIVHSYILVFPHIPESKVNISEAHLKLFRLER